MGNAYYRTGDNTKAIIAYERALRLSPGDNDVLFNLQFVRNKTVDKIMPRSEMFFVTWYKSLVNSVGVDTWAVLSVLFVIIALVLTLLFLFGDRIIFRKLGFYGAITFLIMFISVMSSRISKKCSLRTVMKQLLLCLSLMSKYTCRIRF